MELRDRDLVIRKETYPMQEATDLVAVRVGGAKGRTGTVSGGGQDFAASESVGKARTFRPLPLDRVAAALGADAEELAHFEKAGWVFLERSALTGSPGDLLTATVLVDPKGKVSLAPPRVSVKLKDPAGDLADVFPVGVVKATPLRFAKGLYSVAFDPTAGKDALEVARELESTGKVEYAEPELLAYIDRR